MPQTKSKLLSRIILSIIAPIVVLAGVGGMSSVAIDNKTGSFIM